MSRKSSWTKEELELLKTCDGLTIDDIQSLIPSKKKGTIYYTAKGLGIEIVKKGIKWTKEELLQLKECSGYTYEEIMEKFPDKQKSVIEYQCKIQGIEVATTKRNASNIKIEDMNKYQSIRRYLNAYNIKLDEELYFDTFTTLEWYHFFIDGRIKVIPNAITSSKNNWISIMRHLAFDIYQMKTKEDILKINKRFLETNRITTIRYAISQKNYVLLRECFPEFKIQPWELKMTSNDYFADVENVDYAIDLFIEEYTVSLEDILNYSDIHFKMREFGIYISLYSRYKSYEGIFIDYYSRKGIQLKLEDFKRIFIGCDGETRLNSSEEKVVFDFIYEILNIKNIEAIGFNKNSDFYNEEHGEKYCPDFIIEGSLDKPIIIEYYGMYNPNNSSERIVAYTEKTNRKNEYYKKLDNIHYIDLYPVDLLNGCKSIRRKLFSLMSNIA